MSDASAGVLNLPTLGLELLRTQPQVFRLVAIDCEVALRKISQIARVNAQDHTKPKLRRAASEGVEPTGAWHNGREEDPYGFYRTAMRKALGAAPGNGNGANPGDANLVRAEHLVAEATKVWMVEVGLRPQETTYTETELLKDYQGYAAAEAARWLGVSVRWVRNRRQMKGYDPETGRLRIKDERLERIIKLAQMGVKQRVIAEEMGVSRSRVTQILQGY